MRPAANGILKTLDLDMILERVHQFSGWPVSGRGEQTTAGRSDSVRSNITEPGPTIPNDIFPHEHRRELRGMRVFAAWLNHDDSRAINSLDVLVGQPGRRHVRHYLIDFGSTLGSGSVSAQKPRAGWEYMWEPSTTLETHRHSRDLG